jgi:hypothetical protein
MKEVEWMGACGDNSCMFGAPGGMGTNGGCRCLEDVPRERRMAIRKAVHALRAEVRRLRGVETDKTSGTEWMGSPNTLDTGARPPTTTTPARGPEEAGASLNVDALRAELARVTAKLAALRKVAEAARALDRESHGWAGDSHCTAPKRLFKALRAALDAAGKGE